jgi:hypothetical protein
MPRYMRAVMKVGMNAARMAAPEVELEVR